ncbi:MAG: hemerythrin domain-containing protein [Acidobacteria bacterium]|nr:hemerythrin domain-containing protein [Acidobacteriota bacterium]
MPARQLFNQIRHQVLVHAQAEEDVFYPSVRNLRIGQSDTLVNDAYREHENMRRLLNEIDRLDAVSDEFNNRLQDLKRTMQHHVEEEEGKIFPMLERQWSNEQLLEVGRRLHDRKRNVKRELAA